MRRIKYASAKPHPFCYEISEGEIILELPDNIPSYLNPPSDLKFEEKRMDGGFNNGLRILTYYFLLVEEEKKMEDALFEWCKEKLGEGWTMSRLKEELYQASFDVDEVFGDKDG